jgi:DNA-binding CsgD family transcriptional regulator
MRFNSELVYAGISILPSLAIFIFMTMSVIQFRNQFLNYFYMAYTGAGILSLVYLFQLILFYGNRIEWLHRINIVELIGVILLIEGLSWLLVKIFYEDVFWVIKVIGFSLGGVPAILFGIASFGSVLEIETFFQLLYMMLYVILILECVVFVFNFRQVRNEASRVLGLSFSLLLLFFLVLFVFERFVSFVNILFNPMPAFFFMWNVLLIVYIWKTILKSGLGKLFEVQKGFADKYKLSSREEEIIQLVLQGDKNSAIAQKLVISEKTVTNHIYNIYKKLGINSRFELICLYKD